MLGLSRAAFGEALGVKADKVKHIETGFQRADHEFLAALRAVYGVDLNTLFSPRTDMENIAHTATPEFIPIPRYTVEASAGHGALVQEEEGSGYYAFNRKFLERRGLKPDMLSVISVRGDSMEPDLRSGDLILLNRADIEPVDGKIYAVRFDCDLFVKRIQRLPGNGLMLVSSNPTYQPITVDAGTLGDIQIIGRVVNSTHEW